MVISKITGRKVLASLGNETVEATIEFEDGSRFRASVPAGISAGKYEVSKVDAVTALIQIEQMDKMLSGREWDQGKLDWEIGRMTFGGNATLAVSVAFWKAALTGFHPVTGATGFPKIMLLLFEGGKHGNKNLSIQEFMIVEDSVVEAVRDFRKMREYLEAQNLERTVGVEGAFSPLSFNNSRALDTIKEVFPDKRIALDIAGSFSPGDIDYELLTTHYRLSSIEDPYSDEEWDEWREFARKYKEKILVVGDDLTVTNPERIKKAVEMQAINAVVIKPNQIGTITGALEAVKLARERGLAIVVSHRGEETNDTWLVDFAISVSADYVKFGGMDRGERVAKYNRLMELGMK